MFGIVLMAIGEGRALKLFLGEANSVAALIPWNIIGEYLDVAWNKHILKPLHITLFYCAMHFTNTRYKTRIRGSASHSSLSPLRYYAGI
jgi:hypothetical protein